MYNKSVKVEKHTLEVLYGTLIRAFQKEQMDYSEKPDGTLFFVGRGCTKDYACFGKLITALRNQSWFMEIGRAHV